jgi:tRNA threonylcarbamoyladenosine biosynthesis protein TsaB
MALGLGVDNGYILPAMDARRNQVYTALFAVENGIISRLFEDSAIALSELKEKLPSDKPIFLVGDGSNLTYNTLRGDIPNLILPPEHKMHQRAVGVGLAANKAIAAGDVGDAASLVPNYLRLSQAERERLEKEK